MNNSIDQQFVEYIVKSLVGNPEAVSVERRIDEKGVLLELTVDPEDLGRVIGKRGATAQSLRTLLRALGTKNDARYNLKIVDNGDGPDRSERSDRSTEPTSTDSPSAPDDANATNSGTTNDDDSYSDDNNTEDALSKTRKELNDLDDLDI
ncbi:KH domain-containing protein [Candidatus Saccharibacteria bacterium]|nr:KH domain-containing protein [Candidatus Saccharibacteria bacterium]